MAAIPDYNALINQYRPDMDKLNRMFTGLQETYQTDIQDIQTASADLARDVADLKEAAGNIAEKDASSMKAAAGSFGVGVLGQIFGARAVQNEYDKTLRQWQRKFSNTIEPLAGDVNTTGRLGSMADLMESREGPDLGRLVETASSASQAASAKTAGGIRSQAGQFAAIRQGMNTVLADVASTRSQLDMLKARRTSAAAATHAQKGALDVAERRGAIDMTQRAWDTTYKKAQEAAEAKAEQWRALTQIAQLATDFAMGGPTRTLASKAFDWIS